MTQIVWFKRDLRIHDHEALVEASKHGPVMALYILEPDLWRQPDMSYRQYQFLRGCLIDLERALKSVGADLVIKVGDAVDIFKDVHAVHPISAVWSHQETGNGWTYKRDKAVKAWLDGHAIPWHERRQHGVIRRLKTRDQWAEAWYRFMTEPTQSVPHSLHTLKTASDSLPTAEAFGLVYDGIMDIPLAGRKAALDRLHSFLWERGETYTKDMSSPVTAYTVCSRLSADLAFGVLSMREVYQAAEKRLDELDHMPPHIRGRWPNAMRSFLSRLRWHCHFIQKLEDEPAIQYRPMHPAYADIRQHVLDPAFLEAWKNGCTGFPMIDACMRSLRATGWLNFRMRAMVMSFASYHLWLPWQETAPILAQLFIDYEPGIHYSQVQMQSGTTGINTIRIYNPVKQSLDQDPDGIFIKQWVPELRAVSPSSLHTPWLARHECPDYPAPLVDEKQARQQAAKHLYALRKSEPHKIYASRIVKKHASRKNSTPKKRPLKKTMPPPSAQGELNF